MSEVLRWVDFKSRRWAVYSGILLRTKTSKKTRLEADMELLKTVGARNSAF